MATFDIKAFARRGAEARIAELSAELADIYRAFPSLKQNQDPPFTRRGARALTADTAGNGAQARKRKRRKMTRAERKAVSERMRKYWAERMKGKK